MRQIQHKKDKELIMNVQSKINTNLGIQKASENSDEDERMN